MDQFDVRVKGLFNVCHAIQDVGQPAVISPTSCVIPFVLQGHPILNCLITRRHVTGEKGSINVKV